ncbi:hypothetical protein CASFOL_010871 [Castilleja foliolosa]|uniref:Protein kinase domain-containing protein n=1 Tax=Castilleja foliolosa TaxID=1961234 RepID=A0ABD3DVB4_9LAMI
MPSQLYLLLKTPFSCFIITHLLLQITCTGQETLNCPPSSCGNIPNISHPFRLKNDPINCGQPKYELACENNTAFLYINNSQKYIVRAINYTSYTIRLADPYISENDSCSLPSYSISTYKFAPYYPYSIDSDTTSFLTFISCPYPVNKSLLLDFALAGCGHRNYGFNRTGSNHTYIKYGKLKGSYIMDNCSIDLNVPVTPLPLKDADKSLSLSEIHSSLLYGFQLSWIDAHCYEIKCMELDGFSCYFDGEGAVCQDNREAPQYQWCTVGGEWEFRCGGMPGWFVNALDIITWKIRLIIERGVKVHLVLRIIIGMALMLWLLIYYLRRRRMSTFDLIEDFLQSNNNLMPIRYSYCEIKKITRGFREKLGQGGYGTVYKGKLRSGHIVAVKLLSKHTENGQDFINEISTIGRIHHVNVVKLVGFCAGRFSNKRALVFDFMPNGSLEKYIFNQENPNPLSWDRKYEIAVGVARGIEYLHRGCDIQILHFDIKPHNILLDDNFTPKISDFGLAKLFSTDKNTVTLTAVRGTIGYVAPELINRGIGGVSYKADIYSFGMLLMEMVGLNKNITANYEESSKYFPEWIYDHINEGKDIETGDADIEEGDNDNDSEGLQGKRIKRKMTVVGLWCIQMSPAERPSMSEVVKMLESDNVNLQIPPQPSESTEIAIYSDQSWGIESSGSMALLGDYASSDLSTGGGKCIEMT